MPRLTTVWTSVTLVALAGIAHAGQSVDNVLLPGEKVRSLMAANGESKTVSLSGLEGGTLNLKARPYKRSAVRPTISIRAPDGRVVDLAGYLKVTSKAAVVKKLPLDATGIWRVTVNSPSGGEFELVTKAKSPLKHKWLGTTSDPFAPEDFVLPVLPGSSLTLKAASRGKPKWSPKIEVVDPDGNVVHTAKAASGKTKISGLILEFLGEYTVRVSGGPGDFKVLTKLKPLKKTFRSVEFPDVEALPVVTAITPSTMDNDGHREVIFEGFAFSETQVVTIFDQSGNGYRLGSFLSVGAGGAFHRLDLEGVPPGTYTAQISTPLGNILDVDPTLELTNMLPSVVEATPSELPWNDEVYVELRGAGFDSDAVVTAIRSEDGLELPAAVYYRDSHTDLHVSFAPPDFKVGTYDIRIEDPAGGERTKEQYVDVLGFKAATSHLESSNAIDVVAFGAAYNDTDDTAVMSLRHGTQSHFVLFDPATNQELARYTPPPSADSNHTPRVAWSPKDNRWALCWIADGSQDTGRLRVVSGDFQTVHADVSLASDVDVSEVHAAANRFDGGFVVAWEQWNGTSSQIRSQVVAPDGSVDLSAQQTVWTDPDGLIWSPVIAFQGANRYFIAMLGLTDDRFAYAVRRVVVDQGGRLVSGLKTIASSIDWNNIARPELIANPNDGSLLLGWSYTDFFDNWHPATLRIEPSGSAGAFVGIDADGNIPVGFIDSMAWNATRNEFVVAMTGVVGAIEVLVRRVDPDGRMRRAIYPELHDGVWGMLFGGEKPGTLGLARTVDDTPLDAFNLSDPAFHIDVGPLR